MVVYEQMEIEGVSLSKASSDSGMMIADDVGNIYTEAIFPRSISRTFRETEIPIENEPTMEDKDAALRRLKTV